MTKRQELEAARNLEADCTLGAGAGFGKYTREMAQRLAGRRTLPIQPDILDVDVKPPC